MTKNAFYALWAIVFLCFAVACDDTSTADREADEDAKLAAETDRVIAESKAAAANAKKLLEHTPSAKQEEKPAKQYTRSHEQAMRVAAEIVTTAALFDQGLKFPACKSHYFNMESIDDTDPAFAEFGIGLPIQQWECAQQWQNAGDVSLDDGKRAFAALMARQSIDKIVRGTKEVDSVTFADRAAVACEIAQINDRGTSYNECVKRIDSDGPTMQQLVMHDEAQRCADAVVTANAGAIDSLARQMEGTFTITDLHRLSFLGDNDAVASALSTASIIPMQGELTKDLPRFCVAPRARQGAGAKNDDGLPHGSESARVRSVFVRVATQLVSTSLLQRNPASGCQPWSTESGTRIFLYDQGASANPIDGMPYPCQIVGEYAANAAETADVGKAYYTDGSMNKLWIFRMWAEDVTDDDDMWSFRQKEIWNNRYQSYESVHFPAYRRYYEQAAWKYGVCGREIAKVNQALISETADALMTKFIMGSTIDNDTRELKLDITEAVALMPRKPVFPGKMKVPAFCSAPEPKKAANAN